MADILIKKALIYNKAGKHNGKRRDILVSNGIIVDIKSKIDTKVDKIISSENLCASGGWLDIGCFNGEPGFEYRETLDSLRAAAAKGGYTHLAPFPTSSPTVDTKSQVQFLLHQNNDQAVTILPIATLSKNREGNDLAELIDLQNAGAVAFSDGKTDNSSTSLLERGLQYLQGRGIKIIHAINPFDDQGLGQINEGKSSVYLGLQGMPAHKERKAVDDAIATAEYTNGTVILHNISLSASIAAIEKAKKSNEQIDVSIPFMNLIHSDNDLISFDPNKKVLPPIRSEKELKKLRKAVRDGKINFITSNHTPRSKEEKDEPFGQAAFGASTFVSAFSALVTYTDIGLEHVISCLSAGPYQSLGLNAPVIAKGEKANMTFFDPEIMAMLRSTDDPSLSKNNPYHGDTLKGYVLGTMNFNIFNEN